MLSKLERTHESVSHIKQIEMIMNTTPTQVVADYVVNHINRSNGSQVESAASHNLSQSAPTSASETDFSKAIHDLLINYIICNYCEMHKQLNYLKHYIDIYTDARAVIETVYYKLQGYSPSSIYIKYYQHIESQAFRVFMYYDVLYYNYPTDYTFQFTAQTDILAYLQPFCQITANTSRRMRQYIDDFELIGQLRVYLYARISMRKCICERPQQKEARATLENDTCRGFYALLFAIKDETVEEHSKRPHKISPESRRKYHIAMFVLNKVMDSLYLAGTNTDLSYKNYYELYNIFIICKYLDQYSDICRAINMLRVIDTNAGVICGNKAIEKFSKAINVLKQYFDLNKAYQVFDSDQIQLYRLDTGGVHELPNLFQQSINHIMFINQIITFVSYLHNNRAEFKPASVATIGKICTDVVSFGEHPIPVHMSLPNMMKFYDVLLPKAKEYVLVTLSQNIWTSWLPHITDLYEFLLREVHNINLPYIFVNLLGLTNYCFKSIDNKIYVDRYIYHCSMKYIILFNNWIKTANSAAFLIIYNNCISNAYRANYVQTPSAIIDNLLATKILTQGQEKVDVTKIDNVLQISADTAYLASINIVCIETPKVDNEAEWRKYSAQFTAKSPNSKRITYTQCDFCDILDSNPPALWLCKLCNKYIGHLGCIKKHIIKPKLGGHSCVDQLFD